MPNLLQAQNRTATVSRPGDGMLVAIDARVEAYQMLADSVLPGGKIIIIHPDKNGVEQITAALASSQASSLHVVCHGEPGCLHLGKTPLHEENLPEYRQQLQQWRVRDIVLVACNIAAEGGESFLRQLREMAGANIAASARRVGNPVRGGSWELEYRLGDVSSPLAFLPEIYQIYPGIFPPSFSTESSFAVGTNPVAFAFGDFNGDGKLDLATANINSSTVTVQLGDGTGTGFSASTPVAVGNSPRFVAVGDFNSDGKLDFAVANTNDSTVTVRLGDGTGTGFTTSSTLAVGIRPSSVAVGDFNQDGKLDLATANANEDTVTVLLGDGTGTGFATVNTFAMGDLPNFLAVADLNGDGKLDLVTANYDSGDVTVRLGDGSGTAFTTSSSIAVGIGAFSVAVADLNGDGKLDLATANALDNTATVLLGDGTGTGFSVATTMTVGNGARSVAVGDFTRDGKLDLAVANFDDGTVTVLVGDGTGAVFPTSSTFTVGNNPNFLAAADLNGDGKLDLNTANYGSSSGSVLFNLTPTVSLAAGNAPSETGPTNGTYTITLDNPAPAGGLTVNYTLEGTATLTADYALNEALSTNVTALTATSFTIPAGQTTATLAVVPVDDGIIEPGGETVTLKLNPGIDYILAPNNGTPIEVFPGGNFAVGNGPIDIAVGDFNGDGKLDFATTNANANTVTVRLGDGTGTGFATASTWGTGIAPLYIATGDFNGDGKLDFAVTDYYLSGTGSVTVRLGDGTGTGFTSVATLTVATNPAGLSFGDFNGDGKLDFIVGISNLGNGNTVAVWLGDGTGTGFSSVATLTAGTRPQSSVIGDFNGDGKLDFAVAALESNNITVWLGDGTGTGFPTSTTVAVGNIPIGLRSGDFNGDGKLDFAVTNSYSNTVTVLLGDGTGTGFSSTTITVGSYPGSVAVGDFNGDGKLDLAVPSPYDSTITLLFGDGTGTGFSSTTFTAIGGALAVADFNGDGKLDFATANLISNDVSIFLNLPQPQATLTIADNDVAGVVVTPAGTDVAEGGATLTYTVVLTAQPTADVNIAITPDAQTTTDAATLTFNATNWNVAQTVTVTAVDDAVVEGTHTSTISHAATSADVNYNGIPVAPVAAQIADNDTAGVTITPISTAATEGGATASYTVVLTSQPTADVTIAISPDAQTTTNAATLTFNASNWNQPQTVTVTAVDDTIAEGNHTGNIAHAATSTDANYNNIAVAGFAANIADNDTAGVLIAATSPTATEGGATGSYTVVLTSQPTADVTIAISPDAQTTTDVATLTFNASNWNVAQTVTVTAVDDSIAEGTHTGNITHAATSTDANYNNIAVAGFAENITDNDSPGISINPTATAAAEALHRCCMIQEGMGTVLCFR